MIRRLLGLTLCLAAQFSFGASWFERETRKVHLDYHLNPWVKDVASTVTLDGARRQVKMLQDSGAQAVQFFAYDHFGHAFYPSRVVPAHPNLRNDYFGNMTQAAREKGIRAIAYVNVLGSVYLFKEHPDWYVVNKDGTTHPAITDWFPQDRSLLCASSPFLEQVFKPLLAEIVTRYSPDAIWMDGGIWAMDRVCYCNNCKRQYRAYSAAELPQRPGLNEPDGAWREWSRWRNWRRKQILDFLTSVSAFVHKLQPGILITDNGAGRPGRGLPVIEDAKLARWAETRETGLDFLSCDPVPFFGNHTVILSRVARFQSTLGLPFDYHLERFQGWGEWHLREKVDLQQDCATVLANGGHCLMADQPWPDGSLEPEVYGRFKEVFDFVKAREAVYRGARIVASSGILAAETGDTLFGARRPLDPRLPRLIP